ncbi:hypothetical protein [Cardiobacterium hominis]|uniref:hypothetical protein n=1 Tax=Cardiobacterium hominis TaxID=2718 RepID=UPI0028D2555C|nr:hypothetical protein [Cardiobacterium hominis]
MTPEQKTAVANLLKADLTSLSHQRLIELCLLYEAAPDAYDTFPTALKTELERRFTATEIGKSDTLYAVLQKKANTYQNAIPLFHQRLLEMAGTVNRDIWFTDNKALFESAIADADVARWLVQQRDILEKCLHNRLALAMLAESTPAATAILSEPTAVALWKNTPNLWDIWPQHAPGMTVIAKSAELTQYIIDTPAALAAVIASDNAMQPLIASPTARHVWVDSAVAMAAVAGSEVAMRAVAGSEVAMRAVAGSQVAMAAVAASSMALAEIVQTATARAALIAHNDNLQAVRQQIYDTVKASWKRKVNVNGGSSSSPGVEATITNPIKSPENALVFACLGHYNGHTRGVHQLKHPDGSIAAQNPPGRVHPTSMVAVDGISFGGASIYVASNFGYSYVELWTKE